jgi:hypothetical protein
LTFYTPVASLARPEEITGDSGVGDAPDDFQDR